MKESTPPSLRFSIFRNWVSLAGSAIAASAVFSFVLLFILDYFAKETSPYLGILTYLVAPAFLFIGLLLICLGWFLHRRKRARAVKGGTPFRFFIDLSLPRHRKYLGVFLGTAAVLLLISSVGSYQTYHVTKSVQFCGTACHSVMEPQFVAYQHSPHAQVECTACHIAPGAKSFVQAKLGGLHQLYDTVIGEVERPIKSWERVHIKQETCEQCHWPKRFVGNLDRTYVHYLDDSTNSAYTVRLLLKVGGSDPTHGPVGGIHWHMNVANKVEYVATDEKRQKIPYVRVTDGNGKVTEFVTKGFTNDPVKHTLRTMDCMDCHNRPAHHFRTPNDSVDLAMWMGKISTKLPAVKRAAVLALTKPYATKEEGLKGIETSLREKFPGHADVTTAIAEVQRIYNTYYFPSMKTEWSIYPNNIGHKDFPGCFRCHDNEHKTPDGKRSLKGNDCNACHTIVGESRGIDISHLDARGLKFKHPEEGWEDMRCSDCHNGKIEDK